MKSSQAVRILCYGGVHTSDVQLALAYRTVHDDSSNADTCLNVHMLEQCLRHRQHKTTEPFTLNNTNGMGMDRRDYVEQLGNEGWTVRRHERWAPACMNERWVFASTWTVHDPKYV